MKIFLAGTNSGKRASGLENIRYVLESFYYFRDWQIPYLKKWESFMLDSGAFTFLNSAKENIDWDDYTLRYADLINKHDIKLFFELDIDPIVGIKEVERLREKLEKLTNKRCIPVWHKSRGLEYFKQMCIDYKYVAIGGIVTKEIKAKEYGQLKWFIDVAHRSGCKVHGLGFTSMKWLPKLNFDSVDSTSWKSGLRFGQLYLLKNGLMTFSVMKNRRVKSGKVIDTHNLAEWCKFQRYAEHNL